MPDVTIQPAGFIDFKTNKIIPTYLLTLDYGKKEVYFVATKFDEGHMSTNCAKVVGFFYAGSLDDLYVRFEEIIRETESTNFVEMMFPWQHVKGVRSLVYKHKTAK